MLVDWGEQEEVAMLMFEVASRFAGLRREGGKLLGIAQGGSRYWLMLLYSEVCYRQRAGYWVRESVQPPTKFETRSCLMLITETPSPTK